MIALTGWMQNFNKKMDAKVEGNDSSYIMETPKIMKQVCLYIFGMGAVLLLLFTLLYIQKIGGVTRGHLNFAIVFSLIGLLSFVAASRWKVAVQEETITTYNVFTKKAVFNIHEIERVYLGKKEN